MKGGHFDGSAHPERAPDVLVSASDVFVFDAPRVTTTNDHGTGCSLSSAIAAGLALGRTLPDAVRDAKSFVLAALKVPPTGTWARSRADRPLRMERMSDSEVPPAPRPPLTTTTSIWPAGMILSSPSS